MRSFIWLLQIGAVVLIAIQGFTEVNLTLRVKVDGAKSNTGRAICGIFTSKESFLKKPFRSQTRSIDDQGKATFVFNGLKSGTYAVSVIYDEDKNGELNKSILGVPTESFGASNNAKSPFGPPQFKTAKFELNSNKTITIHLGKVRH